jgi:energy-coupling factor transporter ATP-binding protein EcfA2
MQFMQSFNQTLGMTIVMVTHEQALAEKYASRMIHLADGRLVADVANNAATQTAVPHRAASGDAQ